MLGVRTVAVIGISVFVAAAASPTSASAPSRPRTPTPPGYEPAHGAVNAAITITDANQRTNAREAGGIASDAAGDWALGGTFGGVIDLGAGQLTAAQGFGGEDIFVALINP